MPTASLITAPVLAALYQAAEEGRFSLGDRVRYEEEHQVLGPGVLIHMTPGAEMTVRDAATLMIITSDNAATNMCIDGLLRGGHMPESLTTVRSLSLFR